MSPTSERIPIRIRFICIKDGCRIAVLSGRGKPRPYILMLMTARAASFIVGTASEFFQYFREGFISAGKAVYRLVKQFGRIFVPGIFYNISPFCEFFAVAFIMFNPVRKHLH